jgi:hypothetical protein
MYDVIVMMLRDNENNVVRAQCTHVLQVVLTLLVGNLSAAMENADLEEYIENGILYLFSIG